MIIKAIETVIIIQLMRAKVIFIVTRMKMMITIVTVGTASL